MAGTSTLERVRAVLATQCTSREVTMFGGRAFMVDDRMLLHVGRAGGLLVRVDPARSPTLVAEHGGEPAEMGTGRSMGPGWLRVPDERVVTDEALGFWIDEAWAFRR